MVVRAAGGTKGTALAWLADHHGLAMEETVCVGDWLNDVSMFGVAGRSFAMGQAPHEVKQAATDVLEETNETGGGIARIVERVFGVVTRA
jgi:hydroxymethylpyrimidine pyrophosphatase-like HAD family hydrolase